MAKAALDNSDLFMTMVSDSTCYSYEYTTYPVVAVHRWCLMFAAMLASDLPAYTVKYRQWNYGTGVGPAGAGYDPWATIQTGTGAHTLWISNASFPGATTYDFLGGRFQDAIVATTPDLVIVSMGHNLPPTCPDCWPNLILDLTESITLAFPNAGMILVGENPTLPPFQFTSATAPKVAVVQNIAAIRGYEFISIYQAFLNSGYVLTDLLLPDGLHPTSPESQVGPENGSHLWASTVMQYFVNCGCSPYEAQQPSTLGIAGRQLLTNGTFEDYADSAASPRSWSAEGAVTVSKDTSFFTNENGYSVHLASNHAPGWISRSLDINAVAGQCVTLAAREYVAAGMPDTSGQLSIFDNITAPDMNSVNELQAGDWRWLSVTHCFPAGIASAGVSIYADSAATGGAVSIDKACLTAGSVPQTCPMGLTITTDNATRVFGATNPAFSGTIAGLKSGDNISATYSVTADSTSQGGTYAIVPTLVDPAGKLANYTVTTYNGVLTITPATPALAVQSSLNTVVTQSLMVGVTVNAGTGDPVPTGSVTLSSDGYTSPVASLTNGSVSISIPAGGLSVGTHKVVAAYTPNNASSTLYDSTSASSSVTVATASPNVTVTLSSASISATQALTVAVAVNGGTGNPIPSGTVTIAGAGYTSAAEPLSGGNAKFSIPAGAMTAGSDTLTATYNPDPAGSSTYSSASTSASLTVSAIQPGFSISATPVSLQRGATSGNTSTVTVTPVGGFNGTVTLSAALTSIPSSANDLPELAFGSSGSVHITGTGAGTAMLTIATTPAINAALDRQRRPGDPWYAAGGVTLAGILLCGLSSRRRTWQIMVGAMAALFVFSGSLIACGGGGSATVTNPGTTAGSYTVTITGTSGSLKASGRVTLTVQ